MKRFARRSPLRAGRAAAAILLALLAGVAPEASRGAEETGARFDIWEFSIDDPGLVPLGDIERAVYPFLGVGRSIEDVEGARLAVEKLHHEHGYATVVVNIPEQEVPDGVVRLDVLDGHVERLHVTGARYFSLGRIKSRLPSLKVGGTPRIPALQRELAALANASADRRVSPVLRQGRAPGAVEVELKVEDRLPLHGAIGIDDDHTADTTRTRLRTELRYDNLWQREHSFGLNHEFSPEAPSEVQILSGTYLFRVDALDALLALYGVISNSDVSTLGGAGGEVGVIGEGQVAGVRLIKPLPASDGRAHNLSVGVDYKNFADTIAVTGGGFETPIDYLRWSAGFDTRHRGSASTTRLRVDANLGVRGLGNDSEEFENKRFKAEADFFYVGASFEQAWASRFGAIEWQVAAQLASGPLISNEQFSLGGEHSVRGYFTSQALVDSGVQTQLDWYSPSFAHLLHQRWLRDAQVLVFADAAYGEIDSPLPGQPRTSQLAGTGFGLHFASLHGISSTLLWAFPLLALDDLRAGESRLHFRVGYDF